MHVPDDDDDLDEEAIPGFSHPAMSTTPHSAGYDKGKTRAPEQLATPSSASNFPHTPVTGNIGSAPNGAPKSNRRMVGGVQVETRCVSPNCLTAL